MQQPRTRALGRRVELLNKKIEDARGAVLDNLLLD